MKVNEMDKAIADVAEVLQFEQWLRFYFLKEEGDQLRLEAPQEMVERVERKSPHLKGLLDQMNNQVVDYQKSQETICKFVGENIEGVKHSHYLVPKVFDAKGFKLEMYLFNLWLKAFEERFDMEPDKGFDEWMELYAEWRKSDEVKRYVQELETVTSPSSDHPGERNIQ